MKKAFAQWFAYNGEANRKVIEIINDDAPQKNKVVMSHILAAHRIWIDRINGKTPELGPWDQLAPEQFLNFNNSALADTMTLLDSCEDLQKEIRYSNTKGQAFVNTVSEILFHLLTHSAYHRGQINQAARQTGMEPVLTDFIFYSRDGGL